MWYIGDVEIKNRVVLAPMAGVSNPAFIEIASEMGLGLAYTELISAEAIVRNNKKTIEMLNGLEDLKIPVGVQLFGSNPETLAKAAKWIESHIHPAIIDINMGCPVPKVATRAEAGSALLKDPKKVYEVVKAVKEAVSIPVTAKIRSGWDKNLVNGVEIAMQIEKAGASAIAIHPRTRSEGYSGNADWNMIKKIKEAVSIPVIGNGDIKSCFDASRMLEETGCDAVMIGRATFGNPWIIRDCVDYIEKGILPKEVSFKEKFDMIKKHLHNLQKTKSEKLALLEIRTHIAWYLKGIPHANVLKNQLFKTKSISEIELLLDDFRKKEV